MNQNKILLFLFMTSTQNIIKSNLPAQSIYIHYPFCKKRCHYCDFSIHALGTQSTEAKSDYFYHLSKQYLDALIKEIDINFSHYNIPKQEFKIKTLYVGGGTPSLIPQDHLFLLKEKLQEFVTFDENIEFSIECDPGTFNKDQIDFYSESIGINRLSMGIQSLNDDTLKKIGRSHDVKQTYQSINEISKTKRFGDFKNVSIDLIMGLPFETQLDYEKTLSELFSKIKPGHISAYLLALEEKSIFYQQNKYQDGIFPLPSNEAISEMYSFNSQYLQSLGYEHYEISSFSQTKNLRSQHNSIYWSGDEHFFGFGMGAASLINEQRFRRPDTIQSYRRWVDDDLLSIEKSISKYFNIHADNQAFQKGEWVESLILNRLRVKEGLKISDISKNSEMETQIQSFCLPYIEKEINILNKTELLDNNTIALTIPNGFLMSSEFITRFLLFLDNIKD